MASTRCGISAKQIQRETGVTYKTAWRMFKQIRSMLAEGDTPLGGPGKKVEMDETGIGPTTKRKYQIAKPKITVFGMVERQGRVRAIVVDDRKQDTLVPMVRRHVLPRTTVFTDDFPSYDALDVRGYRHHRINHSAGVYVVGTTHTQTIEGFWALIKNGLRGVYHSVGSQYLQTYLDEYSFRYSHRFDTQPMFTTFLNQIEKRDSVARRIPAEVEVVPF